VIGSSAAIIQNTALEKYLLARPNLPPVQTCARPGEAEMSGYIQYTFQINEEI
jgi:hypothetical protein